MNIVIMYSFVIVVVLLQPIRTLLISALLGFAKPFNFKCVRCVSVPVRTVDWEVLVQ